MRNLIAAFLMFPLALFAQCDIANDLFDIPYVEHTELDFLEPIASSGCVNQALFINQDIVDEMGIVAAQDYAVSKWELQRDAYEEIGVNCILSEIQFVDIQGATTTDLWLTFSGYSTSTPRPFVGDMAHFVTFQASGGIAAYRQLGGAYPYAVSSLRPNSLTWDVKVLTHEAGHVMGALHTHDCVWGPNLDEALDGCYPVQGNCSQPLSLVGGWMSYCHLGGIDQPLFKEQVATIILNDVIALNAACDTVSPPVDPPSAECVESILTIVPDGAANEITWTYGPFSGGPYDKNLAFVSDTFCIPVDTCWVFTIRDSYGDGLTGDCFDGFFTIDTFNSRPYTDNLSFLVCPNNEEQDPEEDHCDGVDIEADYIAVDNGFRYLHVNNQVTLTNNNHIAIQGPFVITENTFLSMHFNSPIEGTAAGIGFGNSLNWEDGVFMQIYGTESVGYNWLNYYETEYNWLSINQPIGSYMDSQGLAGTYEYMYLVNSVLDRPYNAQAAFKDLSLCEVQDVPVEGIDGEQWTLYDQLGRMVEQGQYPNRPNTQWLPSGMYYQQGNQGVKKIITYYGE